MLFQRDQRDLGTSAYRIMNEECDKDLRFLKKDLLTQVKDACGPYGSAPRPGQASSGRGAEPICRDGQWQSRRGWSLLCHW